MLTKIGEYAIIQNSKDEFLMLQFKEDHDFKWHFPGGRMDEGEESCEGLRREIKEETNLTVTELKPTYTKVVTSKLERKYCVFFITKAKEPYTVKISDEHQDFKWFKKSELDKIDFWQPFYKKMLEENL